MGSMEVVVVASKWIGDLVKSRNGSPSTLECSNFKPILVRIEETAECQGLVLLCLPMRRDAGEEQRDCRDPRCELQSRGRSTRSSAPVGSNTAWKCPYPIRSPRRRRTMVRPGISVILPSGTAPAASLALHGRGERAHLRSRRRATTSPVAVSSESVWPHPER